MSIKITSAMLERMLGIALPDRARDLGALQALYDEIVAEPWFADEGRDEFRDYIAERFVSADMDDRQKRSLLISVAQRFYSR
jgi:hypothetical protein